MYEILYLSCYLFTLTAGTLWVYRYMRRQEELASNFLELYLDNTLKQDESFGVNSILSSIHQNENILLCLNEDHNALVLLYMVHRYYLQNNSNMDNVFVLSLNNTLNRSSVYSNLLESVCDLHNFNYVSKLVNMDTIDVNRNDLTNFVINLSKNLEINRVFLTDDSDTVCNRMLDDIFSNNFSEYNIHQYVDNVHIYRPFINVSRDYLQSFVSYNEIGFCNTNRVENLNMNSVYNNYFPILDIYKKEWRQNLRKFYETSRELDLEIDNNYDLLLENVKEEYKYGYILNLEDHNINYNMFRRLLNSSDVSLILDDIFVLYKNFKNSFVFSAFYKLDSTYYIFIKNKRLVLFRLNEFLEKLNDYYSTEINFEDFGEFEEDDNCTNKLSVVNLLEGEFYYHSYNDDYSELTIEDKIFNHNIPLEILQNIPLKNVQTEKTILVNI